jgi:Tfp pilus assembly protein PilZ
MPVSETNTGASPMQMAWVMTMFVFAIAFFLVFFAIYFFRPRKGGKIIPLAGEKQILDPEEISLPHRAEPHWPAVIETAEGETAAATIVSITHGSGFIATDAALQVGEKLPVTINAPDSPPLQVRVEITWSNMKLPADKVVKRGVGIRFIETGEDAVCLINDAISQDAAETDSDQ